MSKKRLIPLVILTLSLIACAGKGSKVGETAVDLIAGLRDPASAASVVCRLKNALVKTYQPETVAGIANGLQALKSTGQVEEFLALSIAVSDLKSMREAMRQNCTNATAVVYPSWFSKPQSNWTY